MDIDADVRVECIKHAKFFFLHHPELVAEITGTKILISCKITSFAARKATCVALSETQWLKVDDLSKILTQKSLNMRFVGNSG